MNILNHAVKKLFGVFIGALFVFPLSVRAATIEVNSYEQEMPFIANGFCTLSEAIASANNHGVITGDCEAGDGLDTILLPAGDYVLTVNNGSTTMTTGLPAILGSSDLTLIGQGENPEDTVIRRDVASDNFRIFYVRPSAELTLQNMSMTNGSVSTSNGGGILNYGDLHLIDTVITGNKAIRGGGIFSQSTQLIIENSFITDNQADDTNGQGGGLYFDFMAMIDQTTIRGNTAAFGGGVATTNGTLVMANSTLSLNRAQRSTGDGSGGGLYMDHALGGSIMSSTIYGNEADTLGGGAYVSDLTQMLNLTNVTIAENTASTGGGLVKFDATVNMKNTIIDNNSATEESNDCSTNMASAIQSSGSNVIGDIEGCEIDSVIGTDLLGQSAFLEDCVDEGFAGGGYCMPQACNNSPVIGQGSGCDSSDTTEITDQLGVIREDCDMGAVEIDEDVSSEVCSEKEDGAGEGVGEGSDEDGSASGGEGVGDDDPADLADESEDEEEDMPGSEGTNASGGCGCSMEDGSPSRQQVGMLLMMSLVPLVLRWRFTKY